MKEESQRHMFKFLLKKGIKNFLGVPDSTMKYFIDEGLRMKRILVTTREEEAIGIAVGLLLSRSPSLVFMQNAGFGNSISTIASLVRLYKIPLIFLLGWRGYLTNDAPEHKLLGKIQPNLIRLLGLKSKILNDKNWEECCEWAIRLTRGGTPCVLIIRRLFRD